MKKIIEIIFVLIFSLEITGTVFGEDVCEYKVLNYNYNVVGVEYLPNTNNYIFEVKNNLKYVVIKDGIKSKEYDYIDKLKLSPDGKHIYLMLEKKTENM